MSLKVGDIYSLDLYQTILTFPDKMVVLYKGVARHARSMMLLVLLRARTKRVTDRTDHRSPLAHDDLSTVV